MRAGISKSFINKKQRWTNSPRPCFDSHSLSFEKPNSIWICSENLNVYNFLSTSFRYAGIAKKRLLHMCLINMRAWSCALMQMSMEKNMSARVYVCVKEYPRFRNSVHACTPVRESMYVTVMFAVGIVLCERGGQPYDALPLARCLIG